MHVITYIYMFIYIMAHNIIKCSMGMFAISKNDLYIMYLLVWEFISFNTQWLNIFALRADPPAMLRMR